MRAPKSWIGEYAALPEGLDGRALGEALIRAGLEVEAVTTVGADVSGPVVIGRVVGFVEEPQKNGKTIRWCHVDCGAEHAPESAPQPLTAGSETAVLAGGHWPRGVVCGALNFDPGAFVVVALPGATLPEGFAIATRRTYGHFSDGMICAVDELGLGSDHAGILVLPDAAPGGGPWSLGSAALDAMGVRDDVLDMPVTPDMGYCLSIRGLAREAAQALDVPYTDPVRHATPPTKADGHGVRHSEGVQVTGGDEGERQHLDEPGARQGCRECAPRPLPGGETAPTGGARDHGLDRLETHLAADLLDVVVGVAEVRPPGGRGADERVADLVDGHARVLQHRHDARRGKRGAQHLPRQRGRDDDGLPGCHGTDDRLGAGQPAAAPLDEERGDAVGRGVGGVLVDTTLEPLGRLARQLVAPRGAGDGHGIERGAFDHHGRRALVHLGGRPTHHPADADRPGVVGDQHVLRVAGAFDTVERDDALPRPCPCLLYTSPSPRDGLLSRMPSSA